MKRAGPKADKEKVFSMPLESPVFFGIKKDWESG